MSGDWTEDDVGSDDLFLYRPKRRWKPEETPTIEFVRLRCPFCGDVNVRDYGRSRCRLVRYVLCRDCNSRFRVREK